MRLAILTRRGILGGMQFGEVLRTFAEFFEKEKIRYAVAGGLAIHAWGYSRTTYDIDFAVDGDAKQRVIGFTEASGYKTLHVFRTRIPADSSER